MKKITIFVFLVICLFLSGCGLNNDVVTAWSVLKSNKNADILKYDGRIYANLTDVEWFEKEKSRYVQGEKIGEIKRVRSLALFFTNYSATKLPKGTALYRTKGETAGIRQGIIIVELETGEFLYYMQLISE